MTLRAVHAAVGLGAYAAALACVARVDALAPGFWDWQEAAFVSRLHAMRGIAVPVLLFTVGGTALLFPGALMHRFSPRASGGYLMGQPAWLALGYACCVLAVTVVALLTAGS